MIIYIYPRIAINKNSMDTNILMFINNLNTKRDCGVVWQLVASQLQKLVGLDPLAGSIPVHAALHSWEIPFPYQACPKPGL
ncbi:hypothetical protein IBTHAUMO2_290016 [Nitrosopumilaceae archaeon]|nr:hypothetical protein IBTHAUMO2_290016 [Nitrosopumilaceae archaeon]